MAQGKSLEELRRDVDAIDDALHDLLVRRAAATGAIARTKPRTDGRIPLALAMRPAREAAIMRRLAARHTGELPLATVIAVMRQILSASLMTQVPFRLHVFGGAPEFAELAQAHFGSGAILTRHETLSRLLNACADDTDSIGILPLPEGGDDAWWARLARAGASGPRVIAKLPFVAEDMGPGVREAIVAAAIEQEPTGDDTTVLVAEVAPSLSRTRLLNQLKDAGIASRIVAGNPTEVRGPVLLEVDGFIAGDDPRLAAFCVQTELTPGSIYPVGGYANPIRIKAKDTA